MRVWIEVTKDLVSFALGQDSDSTPPPEPPKTVIKSVVPQPFKPTAPRQESVSQKPAAKESFTRTPVQESALTTSLLETEPMYVAAPIAQCYLRPVHAFDTVIAEFHYGDRVLIGRLEGRWAAVERGGIKGWVLKDSIASDKSLVFPLFEEGVIYEASHPETVKARMLLGDMFAASDLLLPLEGVEYVTYRLKEHGVEFAWPQKRPRVAGRWRELLRGVRGAHISVRPVTDAVLEYITEDGDGVVMYVETVRPDETLELTGIDPLVPGRFVRRTLKKEEWHELRPVFIHAT